MVADSKTWRRLPFDVASATRQTVSSDALARLAPLPTIWWYSYDRPALILGVGQSSADVDLNACSSAGIQVLHRSSGGTAVYATKELIGLDVALPAGHPLVLRDVVESYRWLGELWVTTLRELGVAAHLVRVDEARASARSELPAKSILHFACFGSISPYEVLVCGRKLVGLSQVRKAHGVLLQSGIYLRFDARTLTNLLRVNERDLEVQRLDKAAIGLHAAAGWAVGEHEVMNAFANALRDRLGISLESGEWSSEEEEYIAARVGP